MKRRPINDGVDDDEDAEFLPTYKNIRKVASSKKPSTVQELSGTQPATAVLPAFKSPGNESDGEDGDFAAPKSNLLRHKSTSISISGNSKMKIARSAKNSSAASGVNDDREDDDDDMFFTRKTGTKLPSFSLSDSVNIPSADKKFDDGIISNASEHAENDKVEQKNIHRQKEGNPEPENIRETNIGPSRLRSPTPPPHTPHLASTRIPEGLDSHTALSLPSIPVVEEMIDSFELDPELESMVRNQELKQSKSVAPDSTATIDIKLSPYNDQRNRLPSQSKVFRIRMGDIFDKPVLKFAELNSLISSDLVLVFKGVKVSRFSTPLSLEIFEKTTFDIMTTSFYDIYMQEKSLQYRHIFSPDVDDSNELDQFEDDTEATGGILLKLNLKGDITPVHIMKHQTVGDLIEKYRKTKGLSGTVKIELDGDLLEGDDTIESLDLDDDDQLDIHFLQNNE